MEQEKERTPFLRKVFNVLVVVVVTVIMLEVLLQVVDPWGIIRRVKISNWQRDTATAHPTGYGIEPGVYDIVGELTTINDDGLRVMPPRPDAACRVVFLGDSFTFGYGVADTETFPWQVAEAIPEVQFVNAGISAYNIENIRRAAEYYEADLFVYTVYTNDNAPSPFFESKVESYPVPPAILIYWWSALYLNEDPNLNPVRIAVFEEEIALMPDHVVYFSIEDDHLAERANAIVLPETERISAFDAHLSPQGNRTAAEFMVPTIREELAAMGCL